MAEVKRRRRRTNPFEQVAKQLEEARSMQQCISKMLPQTDDALIVELRAIRESHQEMTKALTELQGLIGMLVTSQKPVTARAPERDLLPQDDLREEWHRAMVDEFGPANDQVIRQQIDKLWDEIQGGRPHPGKRGVILLHGLIERSLMSRGVPAIPKLAVMEEDDAVDES